jgi:DNA repair protein RadC
MPTAHELLFALTLADGTDGVLVVQAHADDDPRPTRRDAVFTARLALAADRFGVPLLDHLIVARRGDRYFSFYEFGLTDRTDSYLKRTTGHHAP